ncbi:MAG: uroporphyrinogen decarboxylase family protein [Clostridia bacterium]
MADSASLAFRRVYGVMSGDLPDRVPFIPKIWVDLACELTGTPLTDVLSDPYVALEVLVKAAMDVASDGVRQYHFPERRVLIEGESVIETNRKGRRIGTVDMKGGLMTRLYDASDYHLEDPYTMAHYHYWTPPGPVVSNLKDVKKICVPDKDFYRQIGWGKRQKPLMNLYGEHIAFIGDCDSATLAFHECLRGMGQAMLDLMDEPILVHRIMEKGVAIAVEKGKHHIDTGIKILRLNDSIANMSVISPGQWREFIKPHIREVCEALHGYDPSVRIYCHICGNILPVLEDLLETGLDCIAPLDPLGGFTPAQIREKAGREAVLMGGINTLSFINNSMEELVDEAKTCMRQAGMHGAFLLGSGCVVPRGTARDMLAAVSRTVAEYGVYEKGRLDKLWDI